MFVLIVRMAMPWAHYGLQITMTQRKHYTKSRNITRRGMLPHTTAAHLMLGHHILLHALQDAPFLLYAGNTPHHSLTEFFPAHKRLVGPPSQQCSLPTCRHGHHSFNA
jgi:hypothetical protein